MYAVSKYLIICFYLLFLPTLALAKPLDKKKFFTMYIENHKDIPLEEKIGQLFIVGFDGDKISEELLNYIHNYNIGGVVLFNRSLIEGKLSNITSPTQLTKLNTDLQKESKVKLFISIDQEGGKVSRLKESAGFSEIPSHEQLAKEKDINAVYNTSHSMAQMLKVLGVNLNFAPDVDTNVNPNNPVIAKYGRSFSANPDIVTKNALSFIKGQNAENIITSIKHFPGHGSSTTDSHEGFVDITSTYKDYELKPFRDIIKSGYKGTVMTAHVVNKYVDEKYPASISYKFVTELLRNKLGFQGVVITDDLKMKAIEDNWTLEETLVLGINSGSDILLYGNNLGVYNKTYVQDATAIILKNIENGKISLQRIDESYLRIMNLKYNYLY